MQIQLKQAEIVTALHQYVASKGFDLVGKTIDVAFTAGRKEAGLSAEISIEDAEIPGVHLGETESTKPVLSVVAAPVAMLLSEPQAPTEAPKAPTSSLFS